MRFTGLVLSIIAAMVILMPENSFGGPNPSKPSSSRMAPGVEYTLSFPNAVHHELAVKAVWTGLKGKNVRIEMSRSSPGRYALHEFIKNVYSVTAAGKNGAASAIKREDAYSWTVPVENGTVDLRYTVYGDHADGTYAGIDAAHAHLNGPAVFAWIRGTEQARATVRFQLPPMWNTGYSIATQLYPTADSLTYTAPTLYYLMDSPIEIGPLFMKSWFVPSTERTVTIRMALHHTGSDTDAHAYAAMIDAVVREEEGVFGTLPNFETGRYTFLIDYSPFVLGDGMEHRNSTSITGGRQIATNGADNIGTVSHEFFHCWNVKRIRPADLEPFDFGKANMSAALWFAEGFTNYYGKLVLPRAGLQSTEKFLRSIGGTVSGIINTPAHNYFSAVEMSEQAPFLDGASGNDETNRANTTLSYYPYGEALAFGLDLMIRERFPGVSLDSVMRTMWRRHDDVGHPYHLADIEQAVAFATGNREFAHEVFSRYIEGREVMPYGQLADGMGLSLRKSRDGKAWIGPVFLRSEDGKGVIAGATVEGSPLYKLGLDRRDKILKIDSITITGQKDLDSALALHKPGDVSDISFEQRGVLKNAQLAYAGDPSLELVLAESTATQPTMAVKALREEWLASKSVTPLPELWKYCPVCHKRFEFTLENCPDDKKALKLTP